MLNSVIQRLWFHRPLLKFHSYITHYITYLKVKRDFVHTAQVFTGASTVSLTGHFYMDVRPVLLYFSVVFLSSATLSSLTEFSAATNLQPTPSG